MQSHYSMFVSVVSCWNPIRKVLTHAYICGFFPASCMVSGLLVRSLIYLKVFLCSERYRSGLISTVVNIQFLGLFEESIFSPMYPFDIMSPIWCLQLYGFIGEASMSFFFKDLTELCTEPLSAGTYLFFYFY